jgi:hypothetical protein
LATRAGAFDKTELAALRSWMRTYLVWLESSRQGVEQSRATNNHGTAYDLQVAAVAAFVGNTDCLLRAFFRARERILTQFEPAGTQPQELRRTMTRHYCCFNLQLWVNLARTADLCGHDLWSYRSSDGRGIQPALEWLLETTSLPTWPYPDQGEFDRERLVPLRLDHALHYSRTNAAEAERFAGRAVYHPFAGIAPYWMLARN